jgi:hypothetical protein
MAGRKTGRGAVAGAWVVAALLLPAGCDLTMSPDAVTYAGLSAVERAAADRIFVRMQSMDGLLRAVTGSVHSLGAVATDQDTTDVSVRQLWVMANLGDDRVHVTVWENLTSEQRAEFASWFGESVEAAGARYGTFFYEFVGLHLAGVQAVFAVQGVEWVYTHRSLFNLDRDAERLVATYLAQADSNLFTSTWATCDAIRTALDSRFGAYYSREGYMAHWRELTDPQDPAGQIYMICRHLYEAEVRRQTFGTTFAAEVEMLEPESEATGMPGDTL